MRRTGWYISTLAAAFSLCFAQVGAAQTQSGKGHLVIPASSVEHAGDSGVKAHTNLRIMMPQAGVLSGKTQPKELPPFPGYFFETPASIACLYHLAAHEGRACNPNVTTQNPSGGAGAIAIVDAFDAPNAASDLAAFSAQFGLPAPDFTVVYASGTEPPLDPSGGWELEESLDIEWAHAMAPNAKIFLVEANSNFFSDLFPAVFLAASLVATNGGGEVSMSWGSGEFTQETLFDALFTTPGVVYVASSGDGPGAIWPSTSPNVVSAGGTTISRDPNTGTRGQIFRTASLGSSATPEAHRTFLLTPILQPASGSWTPTCTKAAPVAGSSLAVPAFPLHLCRASSMLLAALRLPARLKTGSSTSICSGTVMISATSSTAPAA